MPSPDDVRARLEDIRAARGFVLPHHGAMAAALPELHLAYEAMYRALTLEQRHLAPLEKEVVWLAILTACEEPVGTHHVHKFRLAGGGDAQAEAVFRLAGWAAGSRRFACLAGDWQALFPAIPAANSYRAGWQALSAPLPPGLACLALIAIHTACEEPWGLTVAIEAAYALAVPEPAIAEAMSLAIWPRGVNRFVKATAIWLGLMQAGRVTPSRTFRAWAEAPGQGAFVIPGTSAPADPARQDP